MFYSQFILAKKGPLGTIWIAAHLERKLRKNQVADTDIGVSVDSILFPDVPIALRLSSHLLLGVVRIYNRKVNYLFDDCSEALLKVKQAFRSTAVDLPPEESKAPYHSITLPEKFDLDDFELPDSDIFHGNYVDHHVSSREQITLQDTMEGVSYSTSKFGLDERFGDGDASGLDLEEELFLNKIGTAGDADESADNQASASLRSMSPLEREEHPEDRATNSETMVDGADEPADLMDYAQAPSTPGLVGEPNLSNAKDASACDDHLEPEYHLMESTLRENQNDDPYAETPLEGQDEAIKSTSEFTDKIMEASDAPIEEDLQTEIVKEDKARVLPDDETNENHQCPNEVVLEKVAAEISVLAINDQQVSEGVSAASNGIEGPGCVPEDNNEQKTCHDGSELASENQVGSLLEIHETQAADVSVLTLEAHDEEVGTVTIVSSILDQPDVTKPGGVDVTSDCAALATGEGEESTKSGEVYCVTSNSEQSLKEKRVHEHLSNEDIQMATSEADAQVNNTNSQDRLVENLNNSTQAELPAPEKLLSVPEGHMDLHRNMPLEVSPGDFEGLDECDAGSKTAAVRKRSFTESTLTEHSLNSVESSRQVRGRKTMESVPDDDDLLSSILVGRRSSVLNVKPTPPLSEVTSMKRTRSVPRSGAHKRKVLMDNTMVLHGDTIRDQLTNTEDIRRVRKKAPCTLPEISMIQKQNMEAENFLGTIFTGVSVELSSLHGQTYDLSRIRVCKDDVNGASLETVTEEKFSSQDDKNNASLENSFEPNLASLDDNYVAPLEPIAGFHLTSPNNENHDNEGLGENNNVIEISEEGVTNELLIVRDNELTDPSNNPLLSENRLEEMNHASTDVDFSQEPTKPNNDVGPDDSQPELLVNVAEEGTSLINSGSENPSILELGDASACMIQTATVNKLDYMDLNEGQAIARDELTEKDDDVNREGEIELGAKDGNVSDKAQGAAVELVLNAENGELEYNCRSESYNTACEEQREMGFSHRALDSMLEEDGNINNSENPEHSKAYQLNMTDAETFGSDMHDRDELNYWAAGNDTDFLNVDDDELTEVAEDHLDDAEETQYAENSGWSSRTRAVSKYLQTSFVKEAECGRKSLSMDNLLTGKSRKEASRMFFETLVLQTRDYIHVEQKNPYDDITIKPRTRLMKSDF